MNARFPGAVVVVAWTIPMAACVGHRPSYEGPWVHRSFYEEPRRELPAQVVLLPGRAAVGTTRDVDGTTHIELEFEASEEFGRMIDRVAGPWLADHHPLGLAEMPALETSERVTVEAHLDLFRAVAHTASGAGKGFGTPDFKLREFDYTLGPGLAWVRERSGVDAGLILYGVGLKNMREVFVGVVDLSSGELLWLHEGSCTDEEEDLRALLERTWKAYPGLEAFARVRNFS